MLKYIKQFWGYIIAGAIALAYFLGIKKGKENEKAYQTDKVLENMESSNLARNSLDTDPAVRDRLHKKYKRK